MVPVDTTTTVATTESVAATTTAAAFRQLTTTQTETADATTESQDTTTFQQETTTEVETTTETETTRSVSTTTETPLPYTVRTLAVDKDVVSTGRHHLPLLKYSCTGFCKVSEAASPALPTLSIATLQVFLIRPREKTEGAFPLILPLTDEAPLSCPATQITILDITNHCSLVPSNHREICMMA